MKLSEFIRKAQELYPNSDPEVVVFHEGFNTNISKCQCYIQTQEEFVEDFKGFGDETIVTPAMTDTIVLS